jgi:phage baseplate assembly protein W
MATVTNYMISIESATWIDVNSQFTLNSMPDLLPDALAVQNSLYNILNCPIGARGRIFQPTYGSLWYQFLQEPIDQTTANKMHMSTIQAIQTWEPRITVDIANSYINPDYTLPGYDVRIAFSLNLTSQKQNISFQLQP